MQKTDLSNYDFAILIDKSGSMSTKDCNNGVQTRWEHAQEQTEALARKCAEYDSDGIDVVVFSGSAKTYNGTTPDKVSQIFEENEPGGSTNTAAALKGVLDAYFSRKASGTAKPLIAVVITDGVPDSEADLAKVITNAANTIEEDGEIGITFVQVGSDAKARAYLKSLDDDLQSHGAKFDIVDTKNDEEMDGISITEILLEAVND